MKTAFAFLLPLLASASLLRADYVVVQKVDGGMQSGEMTIKIKDGKARVDMAPQISTISDSTSGDVVTLMHAQKQFMRIPASQTKALVEQMQNSPAPKRRRRRPSSPPPAAKRRSVNTNVNSIRGLRVA
jgi:hypothetical protein